MEPWIRPSKLLLKIKTIRDFRKYNAVIKYGFDLYPPSSVPEWQIHYDMDYLHRRQQVAVTGIHINCNYLKTITLRNFEGNG
jgi:hypothetical protein